MNDLKQLELAPHASARAKARSSSFGIATESMSRAAERLESISAAADTDWRAVAVSRSGWSGRYACRGAAEDERRAGGCNGGVGAIAIIATACMLEALFVH